MTWASEGACRGMDPAIFFPDLGRGRVGNGHDTRLDAVFAPARAVCLSCPVRIECRDYAVANHETDGMWGGLLPHELAWLGQWGHKTRRRQPPAELVA